MPNSPEDIDNDSDNDLTLPTKLSNQLSYISLSCFTEIFPIKRLIYDGIVIVQLFSIFKRIEREGEREEKERFLNVYFKSFHILIASLQ